MKKKIRARQLTLKNMLQLRKNSYKEFDNEKKFLRLKNPPPPSHNFSNGQSLIVDTTAAPAVYIVYCGSIEFLVVV